MSISQGVNDPYLTAANIWAAPSVPSCTGSAIKNASQFFVLCQEKNILHLVCQPADVGTPPALQKVVKYRSCARSNQDRDSLFRTKMQTITARNLLVAAIARASVIGP